MERRPVSSLVPYARNARQHSDAQIAEIAGSIQEWGWTVPALIDEDGGIIAGHGRILAAQKLGLAEVPVMVARGWSAAQKQAYTLADNQIALHGSWDFGLLKVELADLREQGVDLAVAGFAPMELDQLFAAATDANSEWTGMPEFNQQDRGAFQTIAVHFKDAEAVEAFGRLIEQTVTNKTRFTWFPQIEIERYADKQYATSDES